MNTQKKNRILTIAIIVAFPVMIYVAVSAHEPANKESCGRVFSAVANSQGLPPVNWSETAKECVDGKYFDKLMPTAETKYSIQGKALKVGGRVLSLSGMVVRRSENVYSRLHVTFPTVVVTVGGEEVELRFATNENADRAFKALTEVIAKS
jgi:hypothetical protein